MFKDIVISVKKPFTVINTIINPLGNLLMTSEKAETNGNLQFFFLYGYQVT